MQSNPSRTYTYPGLGLAPGAQLTVYIVDEPNGSFDGAFDPASGTATGAVGAIGTAATNITTSTGSPRPIVINTTADAPELPSLMPDNTTYSPATVQNPVSVVVMGSQLTFNTMDGGTCGGAGHQACTSPSTDNLFWSATGSTTVMLPDVASNEQLAVHELGIGTLNLSDCGMCPPGSTIAFLPSLLFLLRHLHRTCTNVFSQAGRSKTAAMNRCIGLGRKTRRSLGIDA
jgi:hypothetical protein